MKSTSNLEELSDGKLYDIKDMVKADAGGCEDCTACCQGVGDLFALTPYDVFEIKRSTGLNLNQLLEDKIEYRMDKKFRMLHLQMVGVNEACSFLNDDGLCNIHEARPGICRLFPLGRAYEDDDFKYFLQVDACTKPKLGKIKVKKWIGINDYQKNKDFILSWFNFIKALTFRLKFVRDEEALKDINTYLAQTFYEIETSDFYETYYERLALAKEKLSIL